MRLCSIASGSRGNSLYFESGDLRILIDAGLSMREIFLRMDIAKIDSSKIDAILLTHEHIDHIRSVGSIARKNKIPVFASHKARQKGEKYLEKTKVIEFEAGTKFCFKSIEIEPFSITHDSVDPVGFTIETNAGKFATATDFGIVTRLIADKLKNCIAINIESNHDIDMLMNGPYPWELKQRIRSRHGHISNEESLSLLHEIAHPNLQTLIMAHLSEVNNHPEHVKKTTSSFLKNQNICSPEIIIGDQHKASRVIEIRG